MSSAEWMLVRGPSGAWFLAHFTELYLRPNAPRKQAPASSVTLASVTQVINRIKTRKRLSALTLSSQMASPHEVVRA